MDMGMGMDMERKIKKTLGIDKNHFRINLSY